MQPAAHPLADRFIHLDPEKVLTAVEGHGRRCTGRFLVLNSYENRVYQLELEGEPTTWVVGKFYRPGRWTPEAIGDEHRFLAELAELEIPVASPLSLSADEDGPTLGALTGEAEGILFSLFPRIGGRTPDELSDEQLTMLGRLLARIHNCGAAGRAPHRLTLNVETYGHANLAFLLDQGLIPPEARDSYARTVEALLARITPLFADVPLHRIHGDCHLGNLLWTRNGPTFLDFDDMVVGPAVQDVWMLAPSFDAEGQRQREVLLTGYREARPFEHRWLHLVEPLRALRFIHYSTWIARRFTDPIFQRTFTHFGTVRYWQQEVLDLREQLSRLEYDR